MDTHTWTDARTERTSRHGAGDPTWPNERTRRDGIVTIADVAECGCPDWCDLDHDN